METFNIKLDEEEIGVLVNSTLNTLIPRDGTIETAILHGIVKQVMEQADEKGIDTIKSFC
jgi:hypothetical protein